MLDTIDDHDWNTLEDAYGPAVEVPDRIRALATAAEGWEDALHDLYAGIYHQGGYFSATPVAVPYLIAIVDGPPVASKARLLHFLGDLTSAHAADAVVGFDPYAFRSQPGPPDYPEATATLAAIAEGASALLARLGDPAPEVRSEAAWLVSGLPECRDAAVADLEARVSGEPDEGARASQLLALGWMGEGANAALVEAGLADASARVRGAAAIVAARAGSAEPAVLGELEALVAGPPVDAGPWGWAGLAPLAIAALGRAAALAPEAVTEAIERAFRASVARIGRLPDHPMPPIRSELVEPEDAPAPPRWPTEEEQAEHEALRGVAGAVARLAFPAFVDRAELALPSELDARQRALLELASDANVPLPLRAIPWIEPAAMKRFLDPPADGALERTLALEDVTAPAWRLLHELHDLPPEQGARRVEAIAAALSGREALDLLADVMTGAYPHPRGWGACLAPPQWAPLAARVDADAEPLEPALRSMADALGGTCPATHAAFVLRPLARLAADRSEALPEALDPLVRQACFDADQAWVTSLLESLDRARRDAIVGRLDNGVFLQRYLPLCDPDAVARVVVEQILDRAWTRGAYEAAEMLHALGEAAVPHVEAAIDRATPRKRRFFEETLVELRGGSVEHVLALEGTSDGLRARLEDPEGRVVVSLALPAAPKLDDVRPLVDALASPADVPVRILPDDAVPHAIAYKLQRLLVELGVRRVSEGGSTLRRT